MSTPQIQRTFSQIDSSDVYVSYPSKDQTQSSGNAKTALRVVLILGWMEAELLHLRRFTEMYNKIYPSATQILVRTYRKSMFVELPVNKSYVLPAVKLLQDAGINAYDSPASSGLLVHSISNGGAMAQTYLAHCLADTLPPYQTSLPPYPALPAQAIIYDSVPATISFGLFSNFTTWGITSKAMRQAVQTLLMPPVYIAFKLYRSTINRGPDTFTLLRGDMSNPRLTPQHVPQTYIYSDIDELAQMDSVERHVKGVMDRLRGEGINADKVVRIEKFVGSPHVSHVKSDPRRYWAAVVETWEASWRIEETMRAQNGKPKCKL